MTTEIEKNKPYHISQLNFLLDLKSGKQGILVKRKGELFSCHEVRINGEVRMMSDQAIAKCYSPEESGYIQVGPDMYLENPLAPFKAWDEEFVSKWENAALQN